MLWWFRVPFAAGGVYAAAGDPGIPEPWNYVLNYGLVAIVLFMVVTRRFLVPTWSLDACEARVIAAVAERDAERRARNELEQVVRDKYVPALEASRSLQETTLQFLRAAGFGK